MSPLPQLPASTTLPGTLSLQHLGACFFSWSWWGESHLLWETALTTAFLSVYSAPFPSSAQAGSGVPGWGIALLVLVCVLVALAIIYLIALVSAQSPTLTRVPLLEGAVRSP